MLKVRRAKHLEFKKKKKKNLLVVVIAREVIRG